ncbi:MAG: hypothetical protein NXH95_01270 [Pseudomonadaceae bacterium]|nr:hypothetical protein [Pseudomonadaceae bacterium]
MKTKHLDEDPQVKQINKQRQALEKEYADVRSKINTLRREPFLDAPSGLVSSNQAALRDRAIRKANSEINGTLLPRMQEIKESLSDLTGQLSIAKRSATKEVASALRADYKKLLVGQFQARLEPVIDLIAMRSEMDAILQELAVAGHEAHHHQLPRPKVGAVDDDAAKLRSEIMDYIESGWLTAADLPKEIVKIWRL